MGKYLKLTSILMLSLLIVVGCSSNTTTDETVNKGDKTTSEVKVDKEDELTIDMKELEKLIVGVISPHDKLEEVTVDNSDIYVKVSVDENFIVDVKDNGEYGIGMVYTSARYSTITDMLLKNEYWDNITVEIKDIAIISRDSNEASENEYGRYFDTAGTEDIILKQIKE